MTLYYNSLFSVDPSVLVRCPEITRPNFYDRFNGYKDCYFYLKHAQLLKDLFIAKVPCKLTSASAVGVGITAAGIAFRWACDRDPTASEFLELFNLNKEVTVKKYNEMEEVFLQAINYQVHVEPEQLTRRYTYNLWRAHY